MVLGKYRDSNIRALAVFSFLMSWNWMFYFECSKQSSKQEVKPKFILSEHLHDLKGLIDFARRFSSEFDVHLDKADLDKLENSIKFVYRKFKDKLGYTGASKALHVLFPKLFVMWDSKIRKGYNYSKGDENEYFEFLKEMQNQILLVLEEYAKSEGISIDKARDDLIKRCDGYYPTKIIDEYNWLKF